MSKPLIILMCVLIGGMPLVPIGCSDKNTSTSPVQNEQVNDPMIPGFPPDLTDSIGNAPSEALKDSLAKMAEYSTIMERMIAKMDKYVTTNADGTYTLDYTGFLNTNRQNLSAPEKQAAEILSNGVPVVNALVIQERKNPSSTALGAYYSVYWWGVRVCYTGSTAQTIAHLMEMGGTAATLSVPVIGVVIGLGGGVLELYYIWWGGFCINAYWWSPTHPWISRP